MPRGSHGGPGEARGSQEKTKKPRDGLAEAFKAATGTQSAKFNFLIMMSHIPNSLSITCRFFNKEHPMMCLDWTWQDGLAWDLELVLGFPPEIAYQSAAPL